MPRNKTYSRKKKHQPPWEFSHKITVSSTKTLDLIIICIATSMVLYWGTRNIVDQSNLQDVSSSCKFYVLVLLAVTTALNVITVFRWFTSVKHLVKYKILFFLCGYFFGQKMSVFERSGERLVFLVLSTNFLSWNCFRDGLDSLKFFMTGFIISSVLYVSDEIVADIFLPDSLQVMTYTLAQYILPIVYVTFTFGNSYRQEFPSYSRLAVSVLVNLMIMTLPAINPHIIIARICSYVVFLLLSFILGIPFLRNGFHSKHEAWILFLSIVPIPFLLN